jgi:predicted O-linked N-acetylglucosamine transferase (SPINDLY family)
MATPEYAQWVARGRAHQEEGRPVDAMLCFWRAVRADPRAPDPHFVLGEVLWQQGRLSDALAAWREASRLDPGFPAPVQALAEALLATGDAPGARDAADRVLVLLADNARAAMIRGVARLMAEGAGDDTPPAAAVADAIEREPQLAGVATLAGPLALALDRVPDAPGRDALLARIARTEAAQASAPPLLLALLLEYAAVESATDTAEVRAALIGAARDREYAPADHDALRRIAMAVAHFGAGAAREFAERYAALCASALAAPVPLPWPRRTAGHRLRIIVLRRAAAAGEADSAAMAAIAALPRDAFSITVAIIGATEDSPRDGMTTIALPPQPDVAAAKAISAADPDLLIDLAGLAAATGLLLAQRPARATWTLATLPLPNAAPLVDRVQDDAHGLTTALAGLHAARNPAIECALDAAAMAAAWTEAVRAHQQGDRVAALAHYARVLLLQPGFAPAHYLSGVAKREDGDEGGARRDFAVAIAGAPGYTEARLAAARLAIAVRETEAAVALCEEGLAMAPGDAGVLRVLGQAHLARADGAAATAAFEHALNRDVTDGETHYNHGVALQMQRNFGEAARAYQRALAFRPDLAAAHFNLGVLFQEQDATDAAVAAYGEVLATDPHNVAAYKNLGEVLQAAGRVDAWLTNFRRFEARCPKALPLAVQALEVCQHLADFPKLERYLDGLRQERFTPSGEVELVDCLEQLLFLLLYFDVEPSMLNQFAHTYDAAARHVYGEPLPRPAARARGRLRVGYLSADLRNHVMGKMIWSAVAHHDRTRFELFFYSLSAAADDWTEKFRGLADRFEVIAHLPERAAAERIAADDLDLLVDLGTHTKGAKPGILAFKPARVQITHVACAGTVGLSTVDFKLTDGYADVPENQVFQIETPLPMEGCVYPHRHIAPAADHPFHRAQQGIAEDTVVIGAFVSGLKLSRRCLTLWRDVLARAPRAKLAFSPLAPALRSQYERLAAAVGIAGDRLLFLPQGRNDAENQARYALVDFVLDPMPYGGANGTLEALDMGVPVVTLRGKRHGERTSYSILANLGVTETVGAGGREYVEIAARLALDPAFMRDVRKRIREGLARSVLTDMPAHTRSLERAYVAALAAKAPEALAAAGEARDG